MLLFQVILNEHINSIRVLLLSKEKQLKPVETQKYSADTLSNHICDKKKHAWSRLLSELYWVARCAHVKVLTLPAFISSRVTLRRRVEKQLRLHCSAKMFIFAKRFIDSRTCVTHSHNHNQDLGCLDTIDAHVIKFLLCIGIAYCSQQSLKEKANGILMVAVITR